MNLKSLIRDVPDFPQAGILFRDVSPMLTHPQAFAHAIDKMGFGWDWSKIDAVVGIESRGFIFGSALALSKQKGFIPMRKAGKLPAPVHRVSYDLEYGSAALEMSHAAEGMRVVIVDDVLATGGTLQAGIELCERCGHSILGLGVVIDLKFLNSFRYRGQSVQSLIQYEG